MLLCPSCSSSRTVKNGRIYNGKQRFKCYIKPAIIDLTFFRLEPLKLLDSFLGPTYRVNSSLVFILFTLHLLWSLIMVLAFKFYSQPITVTLLNICLLLCKLFKVNRRLARFASLTQVTLNSATARAQLLDEIRMILLPLAMLGVRTQLICYSTTSYGSRKRRCFGLYTIRISNFRGHCIISSG
jgi:hypothetical protein